MTLIFNRQKSILRFILFFFSAFISLPVNGGTFKTIHFEFKHETCNSLNLNNGQLQHFRVSSNNRVSAMWSSPSKIAMHSLKKDSSDEKTALIESYKKMHQKGVNFTTFGSVSLVSGVALLTVGVLEFTGSIEGKYVNYSTYKAVSSSYTTGPVQWTAVENQAVYKNKVLGIPLITLGGALIPVGLALTPLGSRYLHQAIKIKKDAAAHDVIVDINPVLNPATNNYSCSLNIKF